MVIKIKTMVRKIIFFNIFIVSFKLKVSWNFAYNIKA